MWILSRKNSKGSIFPVLHFPFAKVNTNTGTLLNNLSKSTPWSISVINSCLWPPAKSDLATRGPSPARKCFTPLWLLGPLTEQYLPCRTALTSEDTLTFSSLEEAPNSQYLICKVSPWDQGPGTWAVWCSQMYLDEGQDSCGWQPVEIRSTGAITVRLWALLPNP